MDILNVSTPRKNIQFTTLQEQSTLLPCNKIPVLFSFLVCQKKKDYEYYEY